MFELFVFVCFEHFSNGSGKTGNTLNGGGNDDLVCFTVSGTFKGFEALELDNCIVWSSFIEISDTVCESLLNSEDSLRFTFCFANLCFLLGFISENESFLFTFCDENLEITEKLS